jgi:hypothetical protein
MMFADEEHATPGAEREGTHGPRLENANSVRADGFTFEGFIAGKAFDSNSIIADLNEPGTNDALRLWPKPNGFPIAITKSPTSICRGHPTEWPSGCLSAPEAEETATSVAGSRPTNLASNFRPSLVPDLRSVPSRHTVRRALRRQPIPCSDCGYGTRTIMNRNRKSVSLPTQLLLYHIDHIV